MLLFFFFFGLRMSVYTYVLNDVENKHENMAFYYAKASGDGAAEEREAKIFCVFKQSLKPLMLHLFFCQVEKTHLCYYHIKIKLFFLFRCQFKKKVEKRISSFSKKIYYIQKSSNS